MQEQSAQPEAGEPGGRTPLILQDRLAAAFGIRPEGREAVVRGMLERTGRPSAGYWLQLLLAIGIASLGLVLGSGAVVIGAMLISPLMEPIVGLGVGLAIGSPFLALRSFTRVAFSVAVVVTISAALTLMLPFHEVTAEIAARTAPTALDLVIASFCAVAAVYTTVRPGSDTTSTAAGTSIGIALVPPLCVVGYGLGTGARSVAGGAALLFTANLCAILLFAILCFLLLGYSAVSTAELERTELAKQQAGIIRRVARGLQLVFALRYGWVFRVIMPLLLLGAVYVPLREALARVTWQVRVRTAIEGMVRDLPRRTVRSSIAVDHGSVSVRLVTLGRGEDAVEIERDLRERIAAVAGIVPKIEVIAVPDAGALEEVAATIKASSAPAPIQAPPREPDISAFRAELTRSVTGAWPGASGPLLAWRLHFPMNEPVVVEVVHAGPELGAAGAELLGRSLSRELGADVAVRDLAISPEPIAAAPEEGLTWLPRAERALAWLTEVEGLHGCVEVPPSPRKKPSKEIEAVTSALRSLPAFRAGRMRLHEGRQWRAVVSPAPCAPEGGAPADAGAGAP
ncbi:MAG: DUF389 domain-containing protein [Polyangiaceae bacterium]|nr:DUF389 domain-containing protein [Polyangiaceae bacterium]